MPNYNMRMPNRNKQNKVYLNKMPNSSPIQLCLFSFISVFNITYNISIPSFTKYQSKFSENFRSVDL